MNIRICSLFNLRSAFSGSEFLSCSYVLASCIMQNGTCALSHPAREAGKFFRALSCCGRALETAHPLKVVHSCPACALKCHYHGGRWTFDPVGSPSDLAFMRFICGLLHFVDCVGTSVHFCLSDFWVRFQLPTDLLRFSHSPKKQAYSSPLTTAIGNIFWFGL